MTRREMREQAFCILFENAVCGEPVEEILDAGREARDLQAGKYAVEAALGVQTHMEEIDQRIRSHIRGWSFGRLSKVTVALLRLAVYEILYEDNIPLGVSINEAVELAKKYGGPDDAPYINGVLASVVKAQEAPPLET